MSNFLHILSPGLRGFLDPSRSVDFLLCEFHFRAETIPWRDTLGSSGVGNKARCIFAFLGGVFRSDGLMILRVRGAFLLGTVLHTLFVFLYCLVSHHASYMRVVLSRSPRKDAIQAAPSLTCPLLSGNLEMGLYVPIHRNFSTQLFPNVFSSETPFHRPHITTQQLSPLCLHITQYLPLNRPLMSPPTRFGQGLPFDYSL